MKQLFKAVDSRRNRSSWFFFDGNGGKQTMNFKAGDTIESMVDMFDAQVICRAENNGDRERMINPELVAEWE